MKDVTPLSGQFRGHCLGNHLDCAVGICVLGGDTFDV